MLAPVTFALAILLALCAPPAPTRAADLPKSTEALLQKLKLPADILDGEDQELAVPQAWIDGAKKEATLTIGGGEELDAQEQYMKPFAERYPFIHIEYDRGNASTRIMKTLLALHQGKYLADVVQSVPASQIAEFEKLNALADLRDLPTWKTLPAGWHDDATGHWTAFRGHYFCMAYNTDLVKPNQLPKTWDDLPSTAILQSRHLGLAINHPDVWMMELWDTKGEAWATQFLHRLFIELQPEGRIEGINAVTSLTASGEVYAELPADPEWVKDLEDEGAPVGWYCPDIVPLNISSDVVLKGSPGEFAGRLYVNWVLSKEGQLGQFAVWGTPPIHKDLQNERFNVFPDQIRGRTIAGPKNDPVETKRMIELWNQDQQQLAR